MRLLGIRLALAAAVLTPCGTAWAADYDNRSGCDTRAAVWGGYSYANVDYELPVEVDTHGLAATLAGLLDCGALNAQLDLSANAAFAAVDPGRENAEVFGGSATGTLFWREQDVGAAGIVLAYGLSRAEAGGGDDFAYDSNVFSAGVFGQYFVGDAATLAIAGQVDALEADEDDDDGVVVVDRHSWSVDAAAKFYMSQRFAALVTAGYTADEYDYGVESSDHIRAGLGVEYLFANCNLSAFAAGLASFDSLRFEGDEGPGAEFDSTTLTAMVGLRYDFGPAPESLVARDRTGPVTPLLLP